jgi:uncharacterized membrane protein YfcA
MSNPIFITLAFSLAFLIESVFGFGGTIFAISILAFFIDIKEIIFIAFLAASFSSVVNFLTGLKTGHFNKKHFIKLIIPSSFGVVLGAYFLHQFSSDLLLYLFAGFLVFFAIWSLVDKNYKFPWLIEKILIFGGGIITGIFGGGGPFAVLVTKQAIKHKTEIRATLAGFFVAQNLIRAVQYSWQQTFDMSKILDIWWFFIPLALAISLGYKIHLAISEKLFQKTTAILLLLAGVSLFFK